MEGKSTFFFFKTKYSYASILARKEKNFVQKKNFQKEKKSKSLYVGDLAQNVNEKNLYDIFSKMGKISYIKICRDLASGKSLGYSYVKFLYLENAQTAIETLNYYSDPNITTKHLRVMWDEKNKKLRNSGNGNVFVKNLPLNFDSKSLFNLFSHYGEILSCKVMSDLNKRLMGFGFVQFKKKKDSETAIRKTNGLTLDGKQIFVGPFLSKEKRKKQGLPKITFTNVYIKNILVENCSEEYIRDLFEIFGPITSIFIPKKNKTPLGFAFVNFEFSEDAEDAIFKMNNKKIKEKILYVSKAETKIARKQHLKKKFLEKKLCSIDSLPVVYLALFYVPNFLNFNFLISKSSFFGQFKNCKVLVEGREVSSKFVFYCFEKIKISSNYFKSKEFFKKKNIKIVDFKKITFFCKSEKKQIVKSKLFKKKVGNLKKKEWEKRKNFFYILFKFSNWKTNINLVLLLIRSFFQTHNFFYKKKTLKCFFIKKSDFISIFFCKKISKKVSCY